MDSHQVIRRPLHSEKSVEDVRLNNQYHFEVDPKATKPVIRRAIEELFPEVRIVSINTLWMRGKVRRVGYTRGRTPDRKKALVKLRPGDTIDIGY